VNYGAVAPDYAQRLLGEQDGGYRYDCPIWEIETGP